jgi:hypothetical protein
MIDSSTGNRNPVPPIIHVIDEALGRLLYFPIGYQRGLLHNSEIGSGEFALGHERPLQPIRFMSAYLPERSLSVPKLEASASLARDGHFAADLG